MDRVKYPVRVLWVGGEARWLVFLSTGERVVDVVEDCFVGFMLMKGRA